MKQDIGNSWTKASIGNQIFKFYRHASKDEIKEHSKPEKKEPESQLVRSYMSGKGKAQKREALMGHLMWFLRLTTISLEWRHMIEHLRYPERCLGNCLEKVEVQSKWHIHELLFVKDVYYATRMSAMTRGSKQIAY